MTDECDRERKKKPRESGLDYIISWFFIPMSLVYILMHTSISI